MRGVVGKPMKLSLRELASMVIASVLYLGFRVWGLGFGVWGLGFRL